MHMPSVQKQPPSVVLAQRLHLVETHGRKLLDLPGHVGLVPARRRERPHPLVQRALPGGTAARRNTPSSRRRMPLSVTTLTTRCPGDVT